MNEDMFFSPKEAKMLNEKVRTEVASHLFLVCNYNPDKIFNPINIDAKFIKAALCFYNFLVDSSICNMLYVIENNHKIQHTNLSDIINKISAIRTIFAHNYDDDNGNIKEKTIVEKWLLGMIGKKTINTIDDYEKALTELKSLREECMQVLLEFLTQISLIKDKTAIIADWEYLIIKFYQRPNNRNILEGQLVACFNAYVATSKINKRLKDEVKNFLIRKKEIKGCNDWFEEKKKNFNPKQQNIIEELLKRYSEERNANIQSIREFVHKEEIDLKPKDYYDFYLQKRLLEKVENLIKNNSNSISLLPQDIIQTVIYEDFSEWRVDTINKI